VEIRVDEHCSAQPRGIEHTDGRSVPQIFINGIQIDGFDELAALDREGALDAMLAE
jgi:glutaredoxin 3